MRIPGVWQSPVHIFSLRSMPRAMWCTWYKGGPCVYHIGTTRTGQLWSIAVNYGATKTAIVLAGFAK